MAARYPPTLGITGFDGGTKPAIALATRRSLVDSGGVEGGGNPPPPEETGACCADDGTCSITTEVECDGTYQGDGTTCDPNPCSTTPTGACCTDGVCSILSESDCTDGGGNYLGDDSTCDDVDCTQGACCADDGSCSITAEADCTGNYQGDGTVCDPNPCCCGFDAFDGSGRKFLTKTTVIHNVCNFVQIDCEVPDGTCAADNTCDLSKVDSYDPVTCVLTSGSYTGTAAVHFYHHDGSIFCSDTSSTHCVDCDGVGAICGGGGSLCCTVTNTSPPDTATNHTVSSSVACAGCTNIQDTTNTYSTSETLSDECFFGGFSPAP